MGARILVIEDNSTNMMLLVYLLRAFGHEAIEAVDGEQGLDLARSERPDLVLCDLELPLLDGYGVVRALRADPATRGLTVIAASALEPDDGGAALRAAGFDGYLAKAIEPDQFIVGLDALLAPELRSGSRLA